MRTIRTLALVAAILLLAGSGCATVGGAVVGAGIGSISGNAGTGAAIGAGVGAIVDIVDWVPTLGNPP